MKEDNFPKLALQQFLRKRVKCRSPQKTLMQTVIAMDSVKWAVKKMKR